VARNRMASPTSGLNLLLDACDVLGCTNDFQQDVRPACRNVDQFGISQPIDADKKHAWA